MSAGMSSRDHRARLATHRAHIELAAAGLVREPRRADDRPVEAADADRVNGGDRVLDQASLGEPEHDPEGAVEPA
jgi:hypothetical protein